MSPKSESAIKPILTDIDVTKSLAILTNGGTESERIEIVRPRGKKMSPKYDSMRKCDQKEVLRFIKSHPDWALREIGERFGISASRVHQIKNKPR